MITPCDHYTESNKFNVVISFHGCGGWGPACGSSHRTAGEALAAAEHWHRTNKLYCRVEEWPIQTAHRREKIIREFGVKPKDFDKEIWNDDPA